MKKYINKHNKVLFKRCDKNPVLTAADWPYGNVNSVFNPAATLLPDGTTILLCRVEDMTGHSHLCVARSKNGIDGWEIDASPTFIADIANHPEELWGLEDPRITCIPEIKKYVITYTAYSENGPGVSLALTEDFKHFTRYGLIIPPNDKDAALFPEKIRGKWAIIHRPFDKDCAHIWMSFSEDMKTWSNRELILKARKGGWWDANKIGLSPPPVKTPEGWLIIYHGVRITAGGCIYRIGLALFDLNMEKCILRGDEWVFGPEEPYEVIGDVGNVVFPCGYTVRPDGNTLYIYYGCADTSIGLATADINEILEWLKQNGRPPCET